MKILNIISIVLVLSLTTVISAEEADNSAFVEDTGNGWNDVAVTQDSEAEVVDAAPVEDTSTVEVEDTKTLADDTSTVGTSDANETFVEDSNTSFVEDTNSSFVEDENTTTWDEESSTQDSGYVETKKLSEFEKLFVNHIAFNFYKTGILSLYQGDYKSAYENAMNAKEIIDNTELNATTIALPFMPSFVRESAYSPKRTFYKIVKQKEYKLKRLVTKAKLISPPIASVVIHRTSTTIDIILRNHGDLPFDEFEVLVNEEPIAMYEKLLPNEEKTIKIQSAPKLYEVSFKEKYGFAPKSFMLSEEY